MNFNFKRDENYFRITQKTYFCDIVLIYSTPHQQVIFEGKLSTIIIFKQCIKCQVDVNRVTLWVFFSYERCPWYFSPLGICSGTYLHDPVPSGCFVFIFKSVSQFQRYMLFLRFEKKPRCTCSSHLRVKQYRKVASWLVLSLSLFIKVCCGLLS